MTAWGARTEGLDKVVRDLNEAIERKHDYTLAGLWAAGLTLQRAAMKKVPVEYGNLRGSAYTRRLLRGGIDIQIERKEFAPVAPLTDPNVIEVGFGAAYALWLHEKEDTPWEGQPRQSGLGVYWGPNGRPKFLEEAVADELANMIRIITDYGSQPV